MAFVEVLSRAAARQALAHRDIGAVFRILRDAGITQVSIAHATGQKQSEISEIISGRQVQSVALLERIADGLGVPRGWMGLAYTSAQPMQTTPADTKTEDEKKADLIRHAGTVLWGKPVFGPAAPIYSSDMPSPLWRRIGRADIEQIVVTTKRLGQLARGLGGVPSIDALAAHTRTSEALLGADMCESVPQELLVALADAHADAATAAWDAGLPEIAREHFIRGLDCAGAGSDLLRAVINLDGLGRLELPLGNRMGR